MKYFVPRFKIATLLAAKQDRLVSKIGGIPWGLPPELWPSCCGHPQKLVAQLCHQPPMLDLGKKSAVLHLFQCLECGGTEKEQGRVAFILDRAVLGKGLVTIDGFDRPADMGRPLIGEAFIHGWDESDDGIPESRLREFYNEKSLWALQDEFPKVDWFGCRERTKFGGSPRWTGNGPMDFPRRPFEFLFQLDDLLCVNGVPPAPNKVGCSVCTYSYANGRVSNEATVQPQPSCRRPNAPWYISHERSTDYFSFEFTNLGSDGTLWVFVNRTRQPHRVKWFWHR